MDKKTLKSIALVTAGCFIFSFCINWLIIPNHMGEGGVTGVSILIYYILGIAPAISSGVMNILLLLVGFRYLDKRTLAFTVYAVILLSFFQKIIVVDGFIPSNSIIIALLGGVLLGVGIGMVVLGGGTTAGGDILVMMMNKYLGVSMSAGFLIIDTLVILSTTFVIGLEKSVLTLAMIFVFSKTLNFILEGFNPKKSVMIISEYSDAIALEIQNKIQRGITVFKAYGHYSKNDKEVLYIVISRNQIMPIQRIVHDIDTSAFMIISDVHQVHGEGFSFYLDETTGERIIN